MHNKIYMFFSIITYNWNFYTVLYITCTYRYHYKLPYCLPILKEKKYLSISWNYAAQPEEKNIINYYQGNFNVIKIYLRITMNWRYGVKSNGSCEIIEEQKKIMNIVLRERNDAKKWVKLHRKKFKYCLL